MLTHIQNQNVPPPPIQFWGGDVKIQANILHVYKYLYIYKKKIEIKTCTVVPTKSDSDVFCLKLLSKTLTCTPHLS